MPKHRLLFVVVLLLLALPESASAYVGPGTGLTVIGAAIAFVGAIIFGIFGFIWYPVKRIVRALSQKGARPDGADT